MYNARIGLKSTVTVTAMPLNLTKIYTTKHTKFSILRRALRAKFYIATLRADRARRKL